MTTSLIDIFNSLFEYDGGKVSFVIDDNEIIWFTARAIADILGYKNPKEAIKYNVHKNDITTFAKLKMHADIIPRNAQDRTVYISEPGLYSLINASNMPKAQEFKTWLMTKVLPEIRRHGVYKVDKTTQTQINQLNEKIKDLQDANMKPINADDIQLMQKQIDTLMKEKEDLKIENLALRNNQKPITTLYDQRAVIYILRPIDSPHKNLFKVGRTNNLERRLRVYNTTVPNNVEVLFVLEVEDSTRVENCIKLVMRPFVYRKNKEYYECSLDKLRDAINRCRNLIRDFDCGCEVRHESTDQLLQHAVTEHGVHPYENLYLGIHREYDETELQTGGESDCGIKLSANSVLPLKNGASKLCNSSILLSTGRIQDFSVEYARAHSQFANPNNHGRHIQELANISQKWFTKFLNLA